MKSLSKFVMIAIVASLVCTSDLSAQSKSKTSKSKTSKSKTSKSKSGTSKQSKGNKGRLPKYFTHLKLKDEQRDEVFAVQAKYKKQIDDLLEELGELKEKQQDDLYDVLSRTQKTLYNKYVAGTLKVGDSTGNKTSTAKSSGSKSSTSKRSSASSRSSAKKSSSRSKKK